MDGWIIRPFPCPLASVIYQSALLFHTHACCVPPLVARQVTKYLGIDMSDSSAKDDEAKTTLSYSDWTEAQRLAWLEKEINSKRQLIPLNMKLSPEAEEVLRMYRIIAHLSSTGVIGSIVISGVSRPSDIIAVDLILREAAIQESVSRAQYVSAVGWGAPIVMGVAVMIVVIVIVIIIIIIIIIVPLSLLPHPNQESIQPVDGDEPVRSKSSVDISVPIIPQFETVEALLAVGDILRKVLAMPTYMMRLKEKCDSVQAVMLSTSDSSKDASRLTASWALYKAEQSVVAACEESGRVRRRGGAMRGF